MTTRWTAGMAERRRGVLRLTCLALAVLAGGLAAAQDSAARSKNWPSWRGPFSCGSADSGQELVDSLDKTKLLWTSPPVGLSGCGHGSPDPLGTGFCDPVIADGRVYLYWFERSGTEKVDWHWVDHSKEGGLRSLKVLYARRPEVGAENCKFNADDVFICLDAETGAPLWKRVFRGRGFNHRKVYDPLCIPAVHEGRLYGLGSAGRVYCLDAVSGKTLWESDVGRCAEFFEQLREMCRKTARMPIDVTMFGNTGVAIADGVPVLGNGDDGHGPRDRGGDKGISGFDARTGERLWSTGPTVQRYGMPGVWRHQGKEYVLAAGVSRMTAVEPRSGKVLWEVKAEPQGAICDAVTLAISGDYVVIQTTVGKSEKGTKACCYKVGLDGAQKAWELPPSGMGICHVGAVIYGPNAYLLTARGLQCVDLA